MKAKTILGLLSFLFGISCITTSCDDMLTPELKRYSENFSGKDSVNFYLGIMGNLQQMVEQNQLLGDLRSDVAAPTTYTTDSIADIMNFKRQADGENRLLNRSAYYKVINQCNFYLNRVDTLASKNGNYFMRREAAQVMLIRAWTYMQLVQNYGRVPFILEPVNNANTGWETSPKAWATNDNLLDLLKDDVERALAYELAYGVPNYGSFNMGNKTIPHYEMIFHARLILGDLYLLRGASKDDYVNAAKYYYGYLQNEASRPNVFNTDAAKYIKMTVGTIDRFEPLGHNWLSHIRNSSENITSIPSAANSSFGSVLTMIPRIYGYDVRSSNSTSTNTDDKGKEKVSTSADISLFPKNDMRQVVQSAHLTSMFKGQIYVLPEYNNKTLTNVNYINQGDARNSTTTAELVVASKEGNVKNKFVSKVLGFGGEFQNKIAIYNLRQVLLRYAEALNRAGYPRFAFAVLHGGLVGNKIPQLRDSIHYDDINKVATTIYYIDSIPNGNNFIDANELRRASADPNYADMLDFKAEKWLDRSTNFGQAPTYIGIRDLGCGIQLDADTVNTYEKLVAQRIEQEATRRGASMAEANKAIQRLKNVRIKEANGTTSDEALTAEREKYKKVKPAPKEPSALEIDAVESLIADQTAMENSFEGFRYYDLMRIARHKNADTSGVFGANNGTKWFAWQIARRDIDLPFYEQPNVYNVNIYNLLLDQNNWYLKNPNYGTK